MVSDANGNCPSHGMTGKESTEGGNFSCALQMENQESGAFVHVFEREGLRVVTMSGQVGEEYANSRRSELFAVNVHQPTIGGNPVKYNGRTCEIAGRRLKNRERQPAAARFHDGPGSGNFTAPRKDRSRKQQKQP